MAKKITIADIAGLTGCSISTVSKALSDSDDINTVTKQAILKAAVESGYSIGRKKAGSKGTIAAVLQCGMLEKANFEYHMLFAFQLAATRGEYDVAVVHVDPAEPRWDFKAQVIDKNYKGAFLLRIGSAYNIAAEIEAGKLPVAAFDQVFETPYAAYIGCDNTAGIGLSVRHLAALGHTRIAYYGGTPTALVSMERKKSFIASMRAAGLDPVPELIAESNFSQNFAPDILPGFLENGVTAVVCASDILAGYTIEEAGRYGLRVPDDLSVVGYDNVPLSRELHPPLTTVDQNIAEIGKNAFFVLENLMQGVPVSRLLFRPRLVERASTAPPKRTP